MYVRCTIGPIAVALCCETQFCDYYPQVLSPSIRGSARRKMRLFEKILELWVRIIHRMISKALVVRPYASWTSVASKKAKPLASQVSFALVFHRIPPFPYRRSMTRIACSLSSSNTWDTENFSYRRIATDDRENSRNRLLIDRIRRIRLIRKECDASDRALHYRAPIFSIRLHGFEWHFDWTTGTLTVR